MTFTPHLDQLRTAARDTYDWDELPPGQAEPMAALLDGHDVLAGAGGDHRAAADARRTRVRDRLRPGPGVVMSVEDDRLTVLFEEVGYRTLAAEILREHPDLLVTVT